MNNMYTGEFRVGDQVRLKTGKKVMEVAGVAKIDFSKNPYNYQNHSINTPYNHTRPRGLTDMVLVVTNVNKGTKEWRTETSLRGVELVDREKAKYRILDDPRQEGVFLSENSKGEFVLEFPDGVKCFPRSEVEEVVPFTVYMENIANETSLTVECHPDTFYSGDLVILEKQKGVFLVKAVDTKKKVHMKIGKQKVWKLSPQLVKIGDTPNPEKKIMWT